MLGIYVLFLFKPRLRRETLISDNNVLNYLPTGCNSPGAGATEATAGARYNYITISDVISDLDCVSLVRLLVLFISVRFVFVGESVLFTISCVFKQVRNKPAQWSVVTLVTPVQKEV